MTTLIAAGILVLILLAVFAPRVLKKVGFLAQSEVGRLGRAAESADPIQQLQERVDVGFDNIAKAKQCLIAEAELVRSSQRRYDQSVAEETRLTNRIKSAAAAGDPNQTTKDNALSLAHVRDQKQEAANSLAKHKENYANFAKQVESAQKQVVSAKNDAEDLKVQLSESQRQAELSTFADSFNAEDAVSGISAARAQVQAQIDHNLSRGDVSHDLSRQGVADASDDALEQQAKADAILAELGVGGKKPEAQEPAKSV